MFLFPMIGLALIVFGVIVWAVAQWSMVVITFFQAGWFSQNLEIVIPLGVFLLLVGKAEPMRVGIAAAAAFIVFIVMFFMGF